MQQNQHPGLDYRKNQENSAGPPGALEESPLRQWRGSTRKKETWNINSVNKNWDSVLQCGMLVWRLSREPQRPETITGCPLCVCDGYSNDSSNLRKTQQNQKHHHRQYTTTLWEALQEFEKQISITVYAFSLNASWCFNLNLHYWAMLVFDVGQPEGSRSLQSFP